MTASSVHTDVRRAPLQEPAKRWRNWYRATAYVEVTAPNGVFHFVPGAVFTGFEQPSKEVAEQRARDDVAPGDPAITWLGAFPEGERP